jgi:hypothetical protein
MNQSRPIELRIHGIGGATPDGLLGLPSGAETVRVAGDEEAGFYARPSEPCVEGYVWSRLTRKALLQPLWIFLLPFTLFNVANWMYPPAPKLLEGQPLRRASGRLMFLLGLSITVTYLLWEAALIFRVFYRDRLAGLLDRRAGFAAGILVLILVGVAVLLVARRTRQNFEDILSPVGKSLPTQSTSPPRSLRSGGFWRHQESRRLLGAHLLVGALVLLAIVVNAWDRVLRERPRLGLLPFFVWTARVQVAILFVLLVLYFAGTWGRRRHSSGFRVAGPIVVAIMSVALTTGSFTGLASYIGARTKSPSAVVLDLGAAFGVGAIVSLLGLVVWAAAHWRGRRRELDELVKNRTPGNTAGLGTEPNGLDPRMFKRLAVYRSFARSLPNLDLVVTAASLSFLLVAALLLVDTIKFPTWLGSFGRWLLAASVSLLLTVLVYRSFQVSARAKVGMIWEILTFWPRRFHPFAVRPYAERAVPELESRILHHREEGRPVEVCAHSQGAVLAYAALTELAFWNENAARNITPGVALVTFGAPLKHIYARFFPGYFKPGGFKDLGDQLFKPAGNLKWAWRNFYRRTDYVGRGLFEETPLKDRDEEIPDPPRRPSQAELCSQALSAMGPDPPQPIWTRPMIHSYYNNAVELREWVDDTIRPILEREAP